MFFRFIKGFSLNQSFTASALLVALLFSANGCKQDEAVKPVSPSFNYVANDVGRWIVYDCDSIIHLDNDNNTDNNVDTSHFQIMEVMDSVGIDGESQPVQHLSRFKRLNDTVPWQFLNRWTAKITSAGYQKVEDNIRYLKLGFPISSLEKWNGNAYNNLGESDYFYGGINVSASFGSLSFDSTLTVIQGDSTIGYHNYPFGMEKYATGIGMYYHYYAAVDFYPGTTLIISGVQYYERINSHGHY
jgi:hypothetical protein